MDLTNKNIIHIKKDGIEYIQFRRLLEYDNIIQHAYSIGGEVDFRGVKKEEKEKYQKLINDYKNLCDSLNLNYINVVKPMQKHTANVKIITEKINKDEADFNTEKYIEIDGVITNKKDIILSTTNADCILLLFFDPIKKVIANVHSGWKGTLEKISVNIIENMKKEYNCNPKDIICAISPSIRKCHFEVEEPVRDLFYNKFKDLKEINEIIEVKIPNKKWKIDTVLINKIILKKIGLKEENIIDSGICSYCNSNIIHSYRASKEKFGLETAIITLK